MRVPRHASTPICGQSVPDSAPDNFSSGINLHFLRANSMPYGRQFRGFGGLPTTTEYGDSWAGDDPALRDAVQADDVVGNGIFDGPGAPPTAHAGTGVFESKFSLPGYLYREEATRASEVLDTSTGSPIIYQPNAGGSWFSDTAQSYRSFDRESPRLYTDQPRLRAKHVAEVIQPPSGGVAPAINPANLVLPGASTMSPQPISKTPIALPTAASGFGAMDSATMQEYAKWALGGVLFGVALAIAARTFGRG